MKSSIFFFLFVTSLSNAQIIHSLDGIENQQGETILLYRLGYNFIDENPIYKLNAHTLFEEKIISAFSTIDGVRGCNDFEFFPGSSDNFMNTGYEIFMDPVTFIARNDTVINYDLNTFNGVDISWQNPSKVFAFGAGIFRSFDGGLTFPQDSVLDVDYSPLSLSYFEDNTFFGMNQEGKLVKNGVVVDTTRFLIDRYFKMKYAPDMMHIYRFNKKRWGYGYSIHISSNRGNSWTNLGFVEKPPVITTNNLSPGEVFMGSGSNIIWKSDNYGTDWIDYKTIPYRVTGLYKKPGNGELYASTRYKLYKITSDTTTTIKSLPVPPQEFDWFPLNIGNRWVYKIIFYDQYGFPEDTLVQAFSIEKDTLITGKTYKKFLPPLLWLYDCMRIDSLDGKLYLISRSFFSDTTEVPYYDFLMELGDTVHFQYFQEYGVTVTDEDSTFIFNEWRPRRNLYVYGMIPGYNFSILKGLGYYYEYIFEGGGLTALLIGCVINGIAYGDTTVSAIEDIKTSPKEFILYQNYPNPFNPVTQIKYKIPSLEFVRVTVYDILGHEITSLVNEVQPAGNYTVNFNGSGLTSGVYMYHLQAGRFNDSKKMILLK